MDISIIIIIVFVALAPFIAYYLAVKEERNNHIIMTFLGIPLKYLLPFYMIFAIWWLLTIL